MTETLDNQTVATELTVFLKNENSSYKQTFLLYDSYVVRHDDPVVSECIAKATAAFRGEVDSARLRISMVL